MRYREIGVYLALLCAAALGARADAGLAALTVQPAATTALYTADGVVEAVRNSQIAAQLPGRVTALLVSAGDSVRQGQELVRIDQRIAAEQLSASRAQLQAASNEYQRQRQLFEQQYISRAAMDRAEAQFKAARAQSNSAATVTELHSIDAPYAGVIATVPIEVGDMAMPGTPLLTLYDPQHLRVVVDIPESVVGQLRGDAKATVEIPAAALRLEAAAIEILPTRDKRAHTARIRLAIAAAENVHPGQFARVQLALSGAGAAALMIPQSAVVHRAEFDAVYTLDKDGRPQLRQVHLGRSEGADVEVLAGLDAGERIARDALAAARASRSE